MSDAEGTVPTTLGDQPTEADGDLFDPEETSRFSDRWEQIQARFVDQPRDAVADADELVEDVVHTITTRLIEQRRELETQWQRDEEVSTEELRQSLQRYRDLFNRLLSSPPASGP